MDEDEREPGGPAQPIEKASEPAEAQVPDAPGSGKTADRRRHRDAPASEHLRPIDALARLDAQWLSATPYERWDGYLYVIELTVPWHPRGYPYLRAMTGSNEEEAARTHAAWRETQLASDAVTPDLRPTVCLLPLGRRWLVVRAIGELLIADGGPGHASPVAALQMATLRYRAALEAEEAAPEPAGEAGT